MIPKSIIRDFPWPEVKPKLDFNSFGYFGIECEQVLGHYVKPTTEYILEIGSLLGLSTRFMLDKAPNAVIACVDPLDITMDVNWFPEGFKIPNPLPTLWDQFVANMWDYRQRVIPLRRMSQMGLFDLIGYGYTPDIIYIDGCHEYQAVVADLETCDRFWPNAAIFGDDWSLPTQVSTTNGSYTTTVGDAVHYWATMKKYKIQLHKDRVYRIIKP